MAYVRGVKSAPVEGARGNRRVDGDHAHPRLYNRSVIMSREKLRNPANFSAEGRELFERLVRLRKSRGIDQNGLASALNVSQASIWKWEADKAFPSGKNYAKLAQLAVDAGDRAYFIEKALDEASFLSDVVKVMSPDEQRHFCHRFGIDRAAAPGAKDAQHEGRHAQGGSKQHSSPARTLARPSKKPPSTKGSKE